MRIGRNFLWWNVPERWETIINKFFFLAARWKSGWEGRGGRGGALSERKIWSERKPFLDDDIKQCIILQVLPFFLFFSFFFFHISLPFRILQYVWLWRCSTEFGGHMKERIHGQKQTKKGIAQFVKIRRCVLQFYIHTYELFPPLLPPPARSHPQSSSQRPTSLFSLFLRNRFFGLIEIRINSRLPFSLLTQRGKLHS